MPRCISEYVVLAGGLAVPVRPLRLLFELEERGFRVTHEGDHLVVRPGRGLTDADREACTRWKSHLLALLDYQPPSVQ
jgi:hypothetical protein